MYLLTYRFILCVYISRTTIPVIITLECMTVRFLLPLVDRRPSYRRTESRARSVDPLPATYTLIPEGAPHGCALAIVDTRQSSRSWLGGSPQPNT
uniref:Uncharacterized protein n=1 Tax=Pararge aegeria TaxID=116150 RepID=S4NUL1_9NEOP